MVGVVVLNYINYLETITCVESLLEQEGVEFKIVIVDNGSFNKSEAILREKYNIDHKISIIANKMNYGFAKGMNVGIDYLRDQGCDFIFLANSDLVFSDKNILCDMVMSYMDGVGVISPVIKNTDGGQAVYITFKKRLLKERMLKTFVQGTIKNLNRKIKNKQVDNWNHDKPSIYKGIDYDKAGILEDRFELTGSGYMLTPSFFNHFDRIYPETFLGLEEYALILYLYKAKLKSRWTKTGTIVHKHGASTPKNFDDDSSIKKRLKGTGYRKIIKLFFMTEREISRRYARK